VNSGPAESISFRTGAKPQRERLFFAMAADADTTSADTLGRANSSASGGNCHSWAEGNKLTSGLAAALAQSSDELGTNQPVSVNAATAPSSHPGARASGNAKFAMTPQFVLSAIVARKAS
jgi:hypothetical protein